MKNKLEFPMLKWAKDLFPICRSITGKGIQKTLRYFINLNSEFRIIKFPSGKKVFDWVIPKEWNIKNAFIIDKNGKKYCEFKKSNLHVMGYSVPINKIISKKELLKNIYTQKEQPSSIPYVTSFYKERWGFCMSEKQKKKLPNGNYKVFIDSTLKKGNLEVIEAVKKGSIKKEIFFSSYACHPSMANNELSGPVLLNAILKYVKLKYKKSKYSYRFVILPETIGSIAYLSKRMNILKKNIICGFNLSRVGDERAYSVIESRSGKTLSDDAIQAALIGLKNVTHYSFLYRGSDERQYCSPKVDLPLTAFQRSIYYPEYHTDKDDFKVVTEKGLNDSFNVFKNIIDCFELSLFPKNKFFCEPNLGKRGLHPTISQKGTYSDSVIRRNLIAYSDGNTNIFQICKKLNVPINELIEELRKLKSNKIIL